MYFCVFEFVHICTLEARGASGTGVISFELCDWGAGNQTRDKQAARFNS